MINSWQTEYSLQISESVFMVNCWTTVYSWEIQFIYGKFTDSVFNSNCWQTAYSWQITDRQSIYGKLQTDNVFIAISWQTVYSWQIPDSLFMVNCWQTVHSWQISDSVFMLNCWQRLYSLQISHRHYIHGKFLTDSLFMINCWQCIHCKFLIVYLWRIFNKICRCTAARNRDMRVHEEKDTAKNIQKPSVCHIFKKVRKTRLVHKVSRSSVQCWWNVLLL